MIATNIANSFVKEPKPIKHKKKTPDNMTDVEIRNKLCEKVAGGCKSCDVLKYCEYGQQCVIRNLQ